MPVKEGLDTILVLDFGGQYYHLIARRIREFNVYSEIITSEITPEELKAIGKKLKVKGLILSGGSSSVYEQDASTVDPYSQYRLLMTVIG